MTDEHGKLISGIEQHIAESKLVPKSRAYFVILKTLLIVAIVFVVSVAVYVGSFVFFVFRDERVPIFARFGWSGYVTAAASLPWGFIVLVPLLLIVAELLGLRFATVYRRPLVFSLIAMAFFVTIVSILVERSDMHRTLLTAADANNMPMVGRVYRRFGRNHMQNARFAQVVTQGDSLWTVTTADQQTLDVAVDGRTLFPTGIDIEPGDLVLIIGPTNGATVHARGISEVAPEDIPGF